MSKPTLTLTVGIQASGKSTWADQQVAYDPQGTAVVGRDRIRKTVFPGQGTLLSHAQENMVTKIATQMVKTLPNSGINVIVDDMNLHAKYVRRWYDVWDDVRFKYCHVTLEEAISRNAKREHPIPEEVIRDTYSRFVTHDSWGPSLPKAPERTERASVVKPAPPHVSTRGKAILVDIDGTLAHMGDRRGPYETDKYALDEADKVVVDLVRSVFWDVGVIIMTGRSEEHREVTEQWLSDSHIPWDELHMRPTGDFRKDYVVKSEMFDQHVSGKSDILYVLDDRDSVVAMWREKGLKVFQVAPGNF